MKRSPLFTIACSCWFVTLACCSASAEQPCGQPWQTPLATVKGSIEDVYYATPPGTQRAGLHLGVQTAEGEYVVIHVFPKECVDKKPAQFTFRKGEQVEALGSVFSTQRGTQRNICAAAIPSHALPSLRDQKTGSITIGMCQNPPHCQQICQKQCQGMKMPQVCLSACQKRCSQTSRQQPAQAPFFKQAQ